MENDNKNDNILNKIDKYQIGKNYVRFELSLKGINTYELQKSLQIFLLTEGMQKLVITSSIMANHKTVKNNIDYNYNFWEYKIPQTNFDYLICVCLEYQDGIIKPNGWFIFSKSIVEKIGKQNTINVFESDISGNYSKEPKINKHLYFKNYKLLLNETK